MNAARKRRQQQHPDYSVHLIVIGVVALIITLVVQA